MKLDPGATLACTITDNVHQANKRKRENNKEKNKEKQSQAI